MIGGKSFGGCQRDCSGGWVCAESRNVPFSVVGVGDETLVHLCVSSYHFM
jgi:hypothetical protein